MQIDGELIVDKPTPTETAIAQIWEETLEIQGILPDQSYFDLGGDSLRMIDMLLTVGQNLGRDVDPTLLFEDATLRGFSRLVDSLPVQSQTHENSL
jgi:acyl carrier protein